MITRVMVACVSLAGGILAVTGCGEPGGPSSVVSQPAASAPDTLREVVVTPEMAEALAKADARDGQSDKIVSLCASCALGMDGSKEHSLRVGEYVMYFCSDDCKQAFSEDIPKSVLALGQVVGNGSESP
jgi:hypothetical protein